MFAKLSKPMLSAALVLVFVLSLSIGSVSAQEGQEPEVLLTLTEAEVNAEFQLPSTRQVAVGDVNSDFMADGSVHFSMQVTVNGRDGNDTVLGIIAILIGQVRGSHYTYRLEDVLISSVQDGTSNTLMEEEGIFYFFAAPFNRYLRSQIREAGIRQPYSIVATDDALLVVAR